MGDDLSTAYYLATCREDEFIQTVLTNYRVIVKDGELFTLGLGCAPPLNIPRAKRSWTFGKKDERRKRPQLRITTCYFPYKRPHELLFVRCVLSTLRMLHTYILFGSFWVPSLIYILFGRMCVHRTPINHSNDYPAEKWQEYITAPQVSISCLHRFYFYCHS